MKYLIFFAFSLTFIPAGVYLSSRDKRILRAILMLCLIFTAKGFDINFVSHEWYRGTSRGFEVHIVDIMSLTLLFYLFAMKKKLLLPKQIVLYMIYFFFTALSIINSAIPLYSFFELLKMIRVVLLFIVAYNHINTEEDLKWLVYTMWGILVYIFLTALKQKYVDGIWQAHGPFPHQNSMVMYVSIMTSASLGIALNTKNINPIFPISSVAMGALSILFTFSRGGMICFLLGAWLTFTLSMLKRAKTNAVHSRRIVIIILGAAAALGVGIKAADSVTERFETAPEESANVRVLLAEAAIKMANDKVLGIGLNNFGHKINPPYFYSSHIDRESEDDKNGLVETAYLMTAAESGWHTLVFYMIFLFSFLILAVYKGFRMKSPLITGLLFGFAGGLFSNYVQTGLEWVLKQTANMYELLFVLAVIAAISTKNIDTKSYTLKEEKNVN